MATLVIGNTEIVVNTTSDSIVSTTATFLEPELPTIPAAAGDTLVDPTFGTEIMRLTDENDGGANANTDCKVQYSYWPTFNCDSTYALFIPVISGGEKVYIVGFDAFAFKRGISRQFDVATGSGWGVAGDDCIWSSKDPNILFGRPNNASLLAMQNVVSEVNTDLKDLTASLPASAKLRQMSKSDNDNVFAFHILDSADDPYGWVVWFRDIDTVIVKQDALVDEVRIDKSGRYLVVSRSDQTTAVWDLVADTKTDLAFSQADQGFVHHAPSHQGAITQYWDTAVNSWALGYRRLWAPKTVTRLMGFLTTTQGMHYSIINDNQNWATVSTYHATGGAAAGPFDNEIFQVSTLGDGKVRRICHHRSVYSAYADEPHANISKDGKFIAFQSNWGGRARRDVFVVKTSIEA